MSFATFYASDLQAVYALWPAPLLFLAWRLVRSAPRGGAAPLHTAFVDRWAILFALLTILDPFATGPLVRALGIADATAGTAVMIFFVLLGDFRVLVLCTRLWSGESGRARWIGEALLWTLIAPATALAGEGLVRWLAPEANDHTIWLIYELTFLALALWLRARVVPRRIPAAQAALRASLRRVLGYAAVYYALWAGADVCIQWLELDAGWALRVIPNQLYYGFTVPFVWWSFFAARNAATSTSAQASR